ncbi:MAG: NUDIX domain-containing protein [Gammaproteobacteria bacterium]|nr:NUDIX domain-containing protein [Gammaproteobacteria bacterium]
MKCDQQLRNKIKSNLTNFEAIERTAEKSAAVALIVVEEGHGANMSDLPAYDDWQQTPALLLTTRSLKLRNHPGQWALPGGRIDQGETVFDAAKREAEEEVNLFLGSADLLGRLDDFVTRSGFVMSPLVFWGGKAENMKPNPDEVESIHRIPAAELMREDAPMLDYDEIKEKVTPKQGEISNSDTHPGPVLRMPIGKNWIAAPTAAILYQFREVCILGNQTRVAHFDQPRFAWK